MFVKWEHFEKMEIWITIICFERWNAVAAAAARGFLIWWKARQIMFNSTVHTQLLHHLFGCGLMLSELWVCMCCTHFKSTITPHKLNYFCIFTVAFFISNFTDIQIENLCTFSLDLIQWFEFTAKWASIYCLSMIMSMGMAIGTYISYCYMPPNQNINKMIEPGCAHDVHFESLKYISFFFDCRY